MREGRDIENKTWYHTECMRGKSKTNLSEDGQVEVVVVVGNDHFALLVDAHSDRIVSDAFASDLAQVVTLVAEHLKRTFRKDFMTGC